MPPATALTQALRKLPVEYLMCRDFGHAWMPYTAEAIGRMGYRQGLRCIRCATRRYREVRLSGHIISARYRYPDDYALRGFGQLSTAERDEIRAADMDHWQQLDLPVGEE